MSFLGIFFTILFSLLFGIGIGVFIILFTQKQKYKHWLKENDKVEVVGSLGIPEKFVGDIQRSSCPVITITPAKVQYSCSIGTMPNPIVGGTFNSNISDFREIKIVGEFVDGLRLCSVAIGDKVPIQGVVNIVIL
jgi:hypothetical protein